MRNWKILMGLALLAMAIFALNGCGGVYGMGNTFVPGGGVYAGVTMPNDAGLDEDAGISNVGEADCFSVVMGVAAWGDCSVDAAMKNGNKGPMKKVHHYDTKVFNVLFFYTKTTIVAYGE